MAESGEDAAKRERQLEQYQAIMEAASDVILTIDANSTIRSVNPAITDVFGYTQSEVTGEPLTTLMPEELREQHYEGFSRYLETDERTLDWDYVELPGLHADGTLVPLAISFSEAEYEGERFFTGITRDITERKERESDLELFRNLVDQSNDAVFVIDPETGAFRDVNDTACERLGYGRAELLDLSVLDVETELDESTDWEDHVAAVRSEGNLTFEGTHRRADGTTFPVEVSVNLVELNEEYLLAVARDVTEQREYQRKLEASNERLEQFASAASHDLKEPLRMVTNYLELVDDRYGDELDEDGQEFLEFAVDGAERMRTLIDGLLEYSRVDAGDESVEPVELDEVLEAARENLSVRVEETDAEITAEPLPTVEGDATQLRQVFQNLLSNAIAYSGDEPPRVHVSAERREDHQPPKGSDAIATIDGDAWVVSVHDEGIGMDPDQSERIFEVFQRLHTQHEHAGAGIGLALCRRIVDRHGGDIWVESEPGEWTTFFFTLPATKETEY